LDIITYALLRKGGGGGSTSGVTNGYYNPTDGKFYEDSSYTIPIDGKEDYIYISDDTNKIYRYDGTNFVPLADAASSIQVKVLPPASSGELGNIYQYVGNTTLDLENGCFYKCIYNATTSKYEWKPILVQARETYEDDPIDFNVW